MPEKISDPYVNKTSTICILLLGGVKPEALKEWYPITDREIAQARRRIELLKEVKNHA
jgi:hypothetical protein